MDEYADDQIEEWTREDLLNSPLLSTEEIKELRKSKIQLTAYAQQKLRKMKSQQQSQKIVEATMEHTLRPKGGNRERVLASAFRELITQCGYYNYPIDGDHGILVINVRDVLGIIETLDELAQGPPQNPPDAL